MVVSSRVIDRKIAQTADFQIDGVFNGERAQILLQSMGYTPNSYRAALATEGVMNQVSFAYGLSGFITKPEMETLAKLLNQTRDLRYLLISMDGLLGTIDISDEEMAEYYDANENEFMLEEQVSLEYLELDKELIFDEVIITEEQIRQRYDERQLEYESQVERRASHILLEALTGEDFEAATTLAGELKERIDAGENFEDLAVCTVSAMLMVSEGISSPLPYFYGVPNYSIMLSIWLWKSSFMVLAICWSPASS